MRLFTSFKKKPAPFETSPLLPDTLVNPYGTSGHSVTTQPPPPAKSPNDSDTSQSLDSKPNRWMRMFIGSEKIPNKESCDSIDSIGGSDDWYLRQIHEKEKLLAPSHHDVEGDFIGSKTLTSQLPLTAPIEPEEQPFQNDSDQDYPQLKPIPKQRTFGRSHSNVSKLVFSAAIFLSLLPIFSAFLFKALSTENGEKPFESTTEKLGVSISGGATALVLLYFIYHFISGRAHQEN